MSDEPKTTKVECPMCKGRGAVKMMDWDDGRYFYPTCPKCNGNGQVDAKVEPSEAQP